MATELATQEQAVVLRDEAQRFLPVMTLQTAVERRKMIVQAVQDLMKPSAEGEADGDYGVIPGTKKPTLLQPGADKLCNLFGLVPRFEIVEKETDWTGEQHGGEPFFFYEIKCQLYRGDFLMGEGVGNANSWETKYRFRKTERKCPECGQPALIKGKAEYGGGWVCWSKKNGCGAKFDDDDWEILQQHAENIPNPQIFDAVNTIRKIANKRAKVAATLNATSAHEFFTQDVEDLPAPAAPSTATAAPAAPPQPRNDTPERRDPWSPLPLPPGVLALWSSLGNPPTKGKIVSALKYMESQIVELSGSSAAYLQIMAQHGMDDPADCMKVGIGPTRMALRDLYLTIERWRKANTPPPAATDPKDDWVPTLDEMQAGDEKEHGND